MINNLLDATGGLIIGVLLGVLITKHYKIIPKITTPLIQSYLRHLIITVVAIVLATSAAHKVGVLHFTQNEWLESANALWLAVLPSLRHLIERKLPLVAPLVEAELPQNVWVHAAFPNPVTPPTSPNVTVSVPPLVFPETTDLGTPV